MPLRGQPRYNPRRRSGIGCWLNYQQSECVGPTSSIGSSSSSWTNSHYHTFARLMNSGGPPSPCPSDHPFNSASSSLSESSSSHRSQEDDISIVTGKLLLHSHPSHSGESPMKSPQSPTIKSGRAKKSETPAEGLCRMDKEKNDFFFFFYCVWRACVCECVSV